MNKKIKISSIVIIIISVLLAQFSYAVSNSMKKNNKSFIQIGSEKISIGETLDIDLDLSQIEYDEFQIEISSNTSLKNTYLDEETKVDLNSKNDDNTDKMIVMSIDKTKLNLDKITLHFIINEEFEIGDKIELNAKVTSYETNKNTDETEEITLVEEKKNIEIIEKNDIEEEKEKQENEIENKQETTNKNTNTQAKSVNTTSTQTLTYKGSNNNYLSDVEIEGYSLNTTFSKENMNYFITVESTDSLNVNAIKEDSTSSVQIIGNDNLSSGINKVLISVTAQNGNVRYYRIFVICNNNITSEKNTSLSQTSEVKSALSENIELHASYYLEEVYVQENDYVEAGTNILKYTNGTYLVAPYNCCITKLNIPETYGQCLNSHYIQIESTNILSVSMKIDESNINKICIGKEADITVSALGKTFKGYVTHVGSTASNGKFEIKLEFENDSNVKIGMTSEISLAL